MHIWSLRNVLLRNLSPRMLVHPIRTDAGVEPHVDRAARFPTTHWSVILKARQAPTRESRQALAALCEAYWSPAYAYVRRLGCSVDEAQDLVQDFFVRLLEKPALLQADPELGRFRTLVRVSLRHFLSDERARGRAKKRGAGLLIPLATLESSEDWCRLEPLDDETPDRVYDRRWAFTVLERVMKRLRAEFTRTNKITLFDALKSHLTFDGNPTSYAKLASDLEMSEGAVRIAVYRLRRRYQTLLHDEVAGLVERAEDIDGEIRYLGAVLSGRGPAGHACR